MLELMCESGTFVLFALLLALQNVKRRPKVRLGESTVKFSCVQSNGVETSCVLTT